MKLLLKIIWSVIVIMVLRILYLIWPQSWDVLLTAGIVLTVIVGLVVRDFIIWTMRRRVL